MLHHSLKIKRLGIDTHQEAVVYMRSDCPVCRSEGFESHSRVEITTEKHRIIATLNVVRDGWLSPDEVGLSEAAWKLLAASEGESAQFSHPSPVISLSEVRAKLYGHRLSDQAMTSIMRDVVDGKYTDIQLSAFISACVGNRLDLEEIIGLTKAMIDVGARMDWPYPVVVDKHCVGGLPGNKTTPIIVAIATAAGLIMPKTSSRAITSPAGTADTMSNLTRVHLDRATMKQIVEKEGGCIAWGGGIHLSPADDILIRIERALDVDSEGQLVASILSKKSAAGSTHVVIDMPVGPTAKVRSPYMVETLSYNLKETGKAIGIDVHVVVTDGSQPVGRGIGPALEAFDVMQVLQNDANAPQDLRAKSLMLAAKLLEITGTVTASQSYSHAEKILHDGLAWKKFQSICEAQGGLHYPQRAAFTQDVLAEVSGEVVEIDNRKLSMVAKLAGAPESKAAGLVLHAPLKTKLKKGDKIFTVHAETQGEISYVMDFIRSQNNIITIK